MTDQATATEAPGAPATIQPGITEDTYIVERLQTIANGPGPTFDAWVRHDQHAEGDYAASSFRAWANEHAATAGGTYRVLHFEYGHWTAREFTITARTEYDIDEIKPDGNERPF